MDTNCDKVLHCQSIFLRSSFYIISTTFGFWGPENKFNKLSFTKNMQSTFCSTVVHFILGVYFLLTLNASLSELLSFF